MHETGHVFDQLAGDYDRHRPAYPEELMTALVEAIEAGEHPDPAVVADVGAGTGIATRLLRRHLPERYQLIGVEPGEGMRQQAWDSTPAEMEIEYIESSAEELPFDDAVIAAVVVAQALQWFDRPEFYKEACRVLRPGGTLGILQNNRDWQSSTFLDAYESFMETQNPSYNRNYRAFDIFGELDAASGLQPDPPLVVSWDRIMTPEAFLGMALSSSRFQHVVDIIGKPQATERVLDLIERHAEPDGNFAVRYRSELYLSRRS